MAGIYVHIPFCVSRCAYCDFFSTTQLDKRSAYVQALLEEWQERQDYLQGQAVKTIYFGGGTPSTLKIEDLRLLMEALPTENAQEITLEANPGDIDEEHIKAWQAMGINRLSMGVQSFDDAMLRRLGRRHTAKQAMDAVRLAQQSGMKNLSIDLIYGLPDQTLDDWKRQVATALTLDVPHLSTYCLMIEPSTPLGKEYSAGKIKEVDEDTENNMYDYICSEAQANGYEHYEVSNFAKPNCHSQHNSCYWDGSWYLGLGAGAHSYNGATRQWNEADLEGYIKERKEEKEVLTEEDKYNEKIMLGLRTMSGIADDLVEASAIQPWIERGLILHTGKRYIASQTGQHILNTIIESLMK